MSVSAASLVEPETQPSPRKVAASVAKPLAVTGGDPAGIGPEVVEMWWESLESDPLQTPFFIGPADWLARLDRIRPVQGLAVGAVHYQPGAPCEESSRTALAAMEEAAEGCLNGRYGGVVSGPISKVALSQVGFEFPGQTEFFAARWGGEPTMAFAGGRMRVVLATWHIPLSEVSVRLTPECLRRTVERAAEFVRRLGGADFPRIGVCGLNPHAGEGGLLGSEELEWINPALAQMREKYPGVTEALPGDTLFRRQMEGEFDVVVALYHDQGLAPLKTVEFEESVNITLGLPYVRTSPDHGTAYGLAGRREASFTSFANAYRLAEQLSRMQ